MGGQFPRGTLLVGPPGTGKTLLAKTVGQLLTDEVLEGEALIELAEAVSHGKVTDDSSLPLSTEQEMAA